MASYGVPVAALFGACVFSVGCVGTPVDDGQAEEDVLAVEQAAVAEVPTSEYVYMNGSGPKFFWEPSTIKELKRLAKGPLISHTGQLTTTWLTGFQEGLTLLSHAIGCSLPSGAVVEAGGVKFNGAVGLAAKWAEGPLNDQASQRWVTACLLQTLNGYGVQVLIRLVGAHPGLADQPNMDAASYNVADGTMFGNIFFSDLVEAYACADEDAANACGSAWSASAWKRICDSSPNCGITLLDECSDDCVLNSGNPVCTAPDGVKYPESIAVKLAQDGFTTLNPLCIEG
ncbi:hypothetical protein WMF30_03985 [Sorangium sp. So ce134]